MEPPNRPPSKIITFKDAQAALTGTLEAWLPRLVESNDALEQALLLLRDLHFARRSISEEIVLQQVDDALEKAAKAKSAF